MTVDPRAPHLWAHARAIRKARARLANTYADARRATRDATNAGLSEVAIARALHVNRRTVRNWLGK